MANEKEIFEELCNAIKMFDEEAAKKTALKAVDEKLDLMKGIALMSEALREIGDKFSAGELFLPHVVLASDAMIAASTIFEEHIPKEEFIKDRKGVVVMGTVEGDLHDVGLNIVSMQLRTAGFDVHNIGKDSKVTDFLAKANEVSADIIGASSLLSVARTKQRDLIDEIKYQNLPYKVMVGGAPVTREWAKQINADGYGEDSDEAVETAIAIMEKKKGGKK